MIAKMKIWHRNIEQLLSKMAKFKATIEDLSRALLILCLLVTLHIGVITIEVQGSKESPPASRTKMNWRKTYDDDNDTPD